MRWSGLHSTCCEIPVISWAAFAKRIRVPLGFAFAVVYFWLARPRPWSLAVGILIATLGLLVRAIASGYVRKNEILTTAGPYSYVRNPLYLGSVVTAAGFALAAQNLWIALALTAIFVLVYLPVIRSEETFLRKRFPEFEAYARHVPRLWPRRASLLGATGTFSWQLYCHHREYNALLGALVMIAALAAKMVWWPK
ncbi:MAG: isoprenylcysteine carboxylmethyltransferase family protein [Acidobacteria bacterium]|nr:isoprenylcysteine carboxylmethyltransferase family protein [Acidobacteriota bacterium]